MQETSKKYTNEGMYLQFENGFFLDLSKERIQHLADEYWNNPQKIPVEIRENENFKTCPVCPYRGQNVLCSAIKPLLPFLEVMDNFLSCDKVTAVYVDHQGVIHVSNTSLQNALQYVTNMALFEYCEDAKEYHPYFKGIMPFMSIKEAVAVVHLNLYWLQKGDVAKITEIIKEMRAAVVVTSRSCVQRLQLVCKSDPFLNAYVRTHTFSEMLSMDMENALDGYFSKSKLN